ncbi:hypothetical protein V757_01020 [Pelistega indica]|uniref:Uncharacterized protein n=1 Tax=Pelistega indica TaxID=1414851 RepID=V8G909_9BURK|nr:hypothetical protein V757_01020 [Pelistega indica]
MQNLEESKPKGDESFELLVNIDYWRNQYLGLVFHLLTQANNLVKP